MLSSSLLLPIIAAGFAVAFVHAALPTHWLPFVLAGRGQGWSPTKTLSVTALAGTGHVLFTAGLGIIIVWFGIEISKWLGGFVYIAGGVLIALGLYYVSYYMRGISAAHHHFVSHDHDHTHDHHVADEFRPAIDAVTQKTDKAVILGLLALLTFSPCEGFLPVYLTATGYGWFGFFTLSLVMAIATLAGMMVFTAFALAGLQRVRLTILERYESLALGGLLVLLGVIVLFVE